MKQDCLEIPSSEEEKMYVELLEQIVTLRKEKGLSQKQLAKLTGIRQNHISRFENHSATVTATAMTLLKILNALDYTLTIKPLERE